MLSDRDKELIEYTIKRTLESIGYIKPRPTRMSQSQAYKKYGEGIIKRWVRQGKIVFERRGTSRNSKKIVLIEDIEKVYQSEKNIVVIFKQNLYK